MTYFSKKILITSGPTRAPLDAVRFLSNRSTGRFGRYLAEEATRWGARVTLVHGVGSELPKQHKSLCTIEIETNRDLKRVLKAELKKGYDAVIHAMAVLDFEPVKRKRGKRKTGTGDWIVHLRPTAKIIEEIKKWDRSVFLVGFKLEIGLKISELIRRARDLLRRSHADLVVANQLSEGAEPHHGVDRRHAGYLLDRDGNYLKKVVGKKQLAKEIMKYTIEKIR